MPVAGQNDELPAILGPFQALHQFERVHFRQAGVKQCDLKLSAAGDFESPARMVNADYLITGLQEAASQLIELVGIVFDDEQGTVHGFLLELFPAMILPRGWNCANGKTNHSGHGGIRHVVLLRAWL